MNYQPRKLLLLLACLTALLTSSPSYSADSPKGPYGLYYEHFRYAGARFLPHLDQSWKRLMAQGLAESSLDAEAVSPAGAIGVMQFLPGTWGDCLKALKLHPLTPPTHAKASIICGGWYMAWLDRKWAGRGRTPEERWPLNLAAYNGGMGPLLNAQRRADNARDWRDIEPHHPYRETRTYVFRVKRIFEAME